MIRIMIDCKTLLHMNKVYIKALDDEVLYKRKFVQFLFDRYRLKYIGTNKTTFQMELEFENDSDIINFKLPYNIL